MLSRILIALLLAASLASFGYGFWLVLGQPEAPPVANDIPLTREIARETAARETAGEPPIALGLPIACEPGADCWVLNYVDLDPGPGRRDYLCGRMSYDGHKGTDFALANLARLSEDVPVLAAAAGRVGGVRDGMRDVNVREIGRDTLAGRECGNGVRIEHGGGWVTQYCHMKEGSVLVSDGQRVEAGQVLGAVGLSGLTEFPHLHLSVSRDGAVVDPFRGLAGGPDCEIGSVPLWQPAILAQLTGIAAPILLDAGFADRVPEMQEAAGGTLALDRVPPDAGAVVLWLRAGGMRPGDTARLSVTLPDGTPFFDETITAERHRAAFYRAFGRRNTAANFPDGFPPGQWRGRVELARDGTVTAARELRLTVGEE